MKATDPTQPTAERLKGKTVVCLSSYNSAVDLQNHMKREHPDTNFIVLPIDTSHGDTTESIKDYLVPILEKKPIDAVVFDVVCNIDQVMKGATSPTNPILAANRKLPVVHFTANPLFTDFKMGTKTYDKAKRVPQTVTKSIEKPFLFNDFYKILADAIDESKGQRVGG